MKLKVLATLTVILAGATGYIYFRFPSPVDFTQPWNAHAVVATYIDAQLKEIDPANAVLLVSYDLQNNTAADFRFAEGPKTVVMSRLVSDHSLSSAGGARLSYAAFLPSRQRTRIELQIPKAFNWPAQDDPAILDKLKDAVNQTLGGVEEFVLFDQADRFQIEFPKGWQELRMLSSER